jgi:hypothetical protein
MTNNKGPQTRLAWDTRRSSARARTTNPVMKRTKHVKTQPKALQTAFLTTKKGIAK